MRRAWLAWFLLVAIAVAIAVATHGRLRGVEEGFAPPVFDGRVRGEVGKMRCKPADALGDDPFVKGAVDTGRLTMHRSTDPATSDREDECVLAADPSVGLVDPLIALNPGWCSQLAESASGVVDRARTEEVREIEDKVKYRRCVVRFKDPRGVTPADVRAFGQKLSEYGTCTVYALAVQDKKNELYLLIQEFARCIAKAKENEAWLDDAIEKEAGNAASEKGVAEILDAKIKDMMGQFKTKVGDMYRMQTDSVGNLQLAQNMARGAYTAFELTDEQRKQCSGLITEKMHDDLRNQVETLRDVLRFRLAVRVRQLMELASSTNDTLEDGKACPANATPPPCPNVCAVDIAGVRFATTDVGAKYIYDAYQPGSTKYEDVSSYVENALIVAGDVRELKITWKQEAA